jgi:hypothetical protein
MKPYQILVAAAVLLVSVLLGLNTSSIIKSFTWNKDSRMYFYTNSVKGGFIFAFVGNNSVFIMNDFPAEQTCIVEAATYITPEMFDGIPKHPVSFVNTNLTVARAIDGDMSCYLLANRTKLRFSSCSNSTYNYGINP